MSVFCLQFGRGGKLRVGRGRLLWISGMGPKFKMPHFHIGSYLPAPSTIKGASQHLSYHMPRSAGELLAMPTGRLPRWGTGCPDKSTRKGSLACFVEAETLYTESE